MNTSTNQCPACRSPLSAMATKCEACGTEIQSDAANKTVLALAEKFESINEELRESGLKGKSLETELRLRKGNVIRDFPVPNSREDLLSLLHYIAPRLDGGNADPNVEEWRAKFSEVCMLAKNSFKNNAKARAEVEEIERSVQVSVTGELKNRAKRSPILAITVVVVIVLAGAGLINVEYQKRKVAQCEQAYAQNSVVEKARLDAIVTKVTNELKTGKFSDALATTSELRWDLRADCKREDAATMESQWDQKRNELENLIRSEDVKLRDQKKESEEKQAEEQRIAEEKIAAAEAASANKAAAATAAAESKAATAVRKAATEKEF